VKSLSSSVGRRCLLSGSAGVRILVAVILLAGATGCPVQVDPPPTVAPEAYGGMGDRMAECMQYGSESYCEREVWGGHER
jgi:hypothetical protein